MSEKGQAVVYLRRGRSKRNTGTVLVAKDSMGNIKAKPLQARWKAVWLSPEEVAGGSGKPIRKAQPAKKAMPERKAIPPKQEPTPRWKTLVARVHTYEADHEPDGWPAVNTKLLSELADEIEALQAVLSNPKCRCGEESTGWVAIKCCNICGLPHKDETLEWGFSPSNDRNHQPTSKNERTLD